MGLTTKQSFRFGFLAKCASDGLTAEETLAKADAVKVLLKTAFLGTVAGKAMDATKSLVGWAGSLATPLALAAPIGIGAGAGYGLAKMTDVDDSDVEDVADNEVLDELRRQTERLKRLRAVRDFAAAKSQANRSRPLI